MFFLEFRAVIITRFKATEENKMAKISRKEARDILFGLLFETEFKNGDSPTEIYTLACKDRDIPDDHYVRTTFFGVVSRARIIDAVITKYSKGWKAERLSRVSRTILRIAVYEMLFIEDIHPNISISQAVELSLTYGEDKAKQFVNGVLSGLFKDIDGKDVNGFIEKIALSLESQNESEEDAQSTTEEDVR